MENLNEVNLSRRNFVKGALAAGGAVVLAAAAPAVKPFEALRRVLPLPLAIWCLVQNMPLR